MSTKLTRDQIAARVAQDIPEGAYVNLGIGLPTLVANHLPADREVILHTENGMLGMGPAPAKGQEDYDLINAGKQPVTELPGCSFFHHADSFAMMRGGHLDICVLGAFQVSQHGDLANWHTGAPDAIPAVGGAMDLAIGAKDVFVMMELQTREGQSKLVEACTYPLTGVRCVSRVYTDVAVFDIRADGVTVTDMFGDITADDISTIIYTSGTTGRSKGAMLSHGALAANALALHQAWGFSERDVLLHALPIFHVHGLFVATHCALLSGAPMAWLAKYEDAAVLKAMPDCTVMMGVPTFYTRLLANPGFTRRAAAHMRLFISGSAPLLESTFAEFEARTGQRILERYGMSEAVIITSNPLDGERIAGSVGYPLTGVELRIAGGETGGIEIRGPSVFKGYWQMPEKTAEEFTEDGFFITGDVGRQDPDGRVWISGRAKDLIISGGFNVYPKEVELILDEMDGVVESAVVGVPHADFGEAVVAVVIGRGEEAGMIAALRERLAAFKTPKRVFFVDELPRNAMGKVQKNLLREQYAATFA